MAASQATRSSGSRRARTRTRAGLAAVSVAVLLAGGASFAIAASAEDGIDGSAGDVTTTVAETVAPEPAPAEEPAPAPDASSMPSEPDPVPADSGSAVPAPAGDPPAPEPDSAPSPGPAPRPPDADTGVPWIGARGSSPGPVLTAAANASRRSAPEVEGPSGYATVWLHRALPDPTPPARRLAPSYARMLRETARRSDVDWALLHAVVRARGHEGRIPETRSGLTGIAERLRRAGARRHPGLAAARLNGVEFGERVMALRNYNRAVRLRALVAGLESAKHALERALLRDDRVEIYAGGRADVSSGRVDVRVTVLLRYLAVSFGGVRVSSLRTGHRLFARPGVVSAHVYGLAVDVAALGGQSIVGHQSVGSVTDEAVDAMLRLPAEVQPQQIISLLGLGGPSFALADHFDHIHVGF